MFHEIILSIMATIVFSGSALAGLNIRIYNPGANAVFPVTSTLVYGDKDAVLIDAQFQKKYVLELITEIKATGKNLKTIYISHSDPDFYFGLDELKKAFPGTAIVSTAQTAYLIEASKDQKLAVWGPQLKEDAPSEIIVPKAIAELPLLEGHKLEIIQSKEDPAHSFVWIPSIRTIVGGISVGEGAHLWMADTKNYKALDLWMAQINKMKSLQPQKVIPSHFTKLDESPEVLDFVENYLKDYKNAALSGSNGEDLANKMMAKYPQLPGKESLEMGAKVFKGEMQWDLKSPYPAIGNHVLVNFGGGFVFDLNYPDNKQMRFTGKSESTKNLSELVDYTAVEVSPNVFMVYWTETSTKTNVVHVQNWNTGEVYTNIAHPDGSFDHFKGTMKLAD
ncbi:MBL fold metallo-hydrolase [Chitinophaga oryzae]|uniref:MBL fold metallo-hydrolase n=2 Tax=Chitinophaga oryzae TaxID=2725414 RepID=A0ABX6LFK4_9BACT|nr:MBL fold metallo-hydrolase [Chitinophaga oryzae]